LRRTADRYLASRPDQREFVGPLLELLDQGVDLANRREWRGHVTASAVVLNPDGQVLFIDHVASGKWLPAVGGHLEPVDQSLAGAVLRELEEELGLWPEDLVWLPDTPVHIDVFPIPARETRGEPDHLHLDYCFLLTTERTDFRLQEDEVRGTDWRPLETLVDQRLREGVLQALGRVQVPAQRSGGCLCGAVAYTVTGPVRDSYCCSCHHCARSTGAPTVWWVAFDQEEVAWSGELAWVATWPTLRRAFCRTCGSSLASVADGARTLSLTGASLNDQTGPGLEPFGHSFRDRAPAWMSIALAPEPQPS
jgi:ADP-ribose pyrophosphatase YjhB (NUDIX family)